MSRYGITKIENEYQHAVSNDFYTKCPKAVFAAIAISSCTMGGDYIKEAQERVLTEWWALYDNMIVPQKPPYPRAENKETL